MSYKKIFWGVMLVLIGVMFILKNTGIIFFDWLTIWRLWPLVLILWGISIIPVKDYVKLILSLVFIALSILLVNRYDKTGYYSFGWNGHDQRRHFEWNDNDSENTNESKQEMFQTLDSLITHVELKLEAAAGDFRIDENIPEDKMLTFVKTGSIGNYSMTSRDDSTKRFVELKINESNIRMNNRSNRVQLGLNTYPVWDFDLDIGAASIDFDLSSYRVGNLKIDGGASSIKVKLGEAMEHTDVDIDAGAASIDLFIPEGAGAELKTETALTSRNFQGFTKIKNGLYRTDNFETSAQKIKIDIDAAVSSVNIKRY
ncbi:MAG: DUF5668 domain-containing protein [Lentimicrobium sp.]|jgi:hypothetical protein|nr:DUF5668 domain-containing protein [Lentimicrobium sp.]